MTAPDVGKPMTLGGIAAESARQAPSGSWVMAPADCACAATEDPSAKAPAMNHARHGLRIKNLLARRPANCERVDAMIIAAFDGFRQGHIGVRTIMFIVPL
jgi:hypothetical protein